MLNESKNIIKRLKESQRIKTDSELANKLDITSSTISAWKSRNSIDIILIAEKFPNVSIDWLIKGGVENQNKSTDAFSDLKSELKEIMESCPSNKPATELNQLKLMGMVLVVAEVSAKMADLIQDRVDSEIIKLWNK